MGFVKDENIKKCTEEYDFIRDKVASWQHNVPAPSITSDVLDIYEVAKRIYGRMYAEDNSIVCNPEDLQQDYGRLADILGMMKEYYLDEKKLGRSVETLERCMEQIIDLTHTESAIYNPEANDASPYNIVIADCSFRILFAVFDSEVLGAQVE